MVVAVPVARFTVKPATVVVGTTVVGAGGGSITVATTATGAGETGLGTSPALGATASTTAVDRIGATVSC